MKHKKELKEKVKKELENARQDIRIGKGITHRQMKKELQF